VALDLGGAVMARPGVEAQQGAVVFGYLREEEEEGELWRRPAGRRATAAWLLPAKTELGRGRATLGDGQPFYLTRGEQHSDGWRLGGQRHLTSRPGVGLSATNRWAVLNSFFQIGVQCQN
jgi:hypothetical protein